MRLPPRRVRMPLTRTTPKLCAKPQIHSRGSFERGTPVFIPERGDEAVRQAFSVQRQPTLHQCVSNDDVMAVIRDTGNIQLHDFTQSKRIVRLCRPHAHGPHPCSVPVHGPCLEP